MLPLFDSRTVVASSGPSAASDRGGRASPAAPASDMVVRNRRRVCIIVIGTSLLRSRLQLAFELVQKAPVGAVGDDLLRARFDEAGFVQAQGVETDRVLGVVLPPFVVRQPAESLQRIIV